MAIFKRKAKVETAAGEKQGQMQVLKDAFRLTRKHKPIAFLWMALGFVVVLCGGIILGTKVNHPVYFTIISLPLAVLVSFFLFTRLANTAAFLSIQDQLGAGASVLMAIRKGFTTTPAVNVSRNQDMVHRSVGRPGIVLVGEGTQAVRSLLQDERRKMERFVPGVPLSEVVIGDASGQVSLRKLQKHLKKLPKKLSKDQVREVRNRLKAVGGLSMPIPKGPMPMNRNAKIPKR
ncbi:unannotated protein [freshwater metagenome]|uniref:Unannotated protein n=1 Tax=freshwater metagenome TaxID=449393 RepID=A0A6J6P9I8_9ZZZZ